MDKIKKQILERLDILRETKFVKPTAMDLHGTRHLMNRVQRQEDRIYKQKVLEQQKDLKLKLLEINKYNSNLKDKKERRLDLRIPRMNSRKSTCAVPIFKTNDLVISKPLISIQRMPTRKFNRLNRRKRLGNLKMEK